MKGLKTIWKLLLVATLLICSVVPAYAAEWIHEQSPAELLWSVSYGTKGAAATPPIVLGDSIYSAAGSQLVRFDRVTGEQTAACDLGGTTMYATNPLTYADRTFYVPVKVSGGYTIVAVRDDLSGVRWTMAERVAGQMVSPVQVSDGKVYSGTWSGEEADGSYFCLDASTGQVLWRFTPSQDDADTPLPRGFYWAGAYVNDRYIAVGCDDGKPEKNQSASSILYILDPASGQILDKLEGLEGDIRSTVVFDDGNLYFTAKGRVLYKVAVDADGKLGEVQTLRMSGAMTGTPVIVDGRLYIGVSGTNTDANYSEDGQQRFAAIDTASMTEVASHETPGYPQVTATVAGSDDQGHTALYFTVNAKPGGVYYFVDDGSATGQLGTVYEPQESAWEYCLSTVAIADDGAIYYKNDSNRIFALAPNAAYADRISVVSGSEEAEWNEHFKAYRMEYDLVTGEASVKVNVDVPEGQSAEIRVDGSVSDGNITLGSEPKAVRINVQNGTAKRSYRLNIRRKSDGAALTSLLVSNSSSIGKGLIDVRSSANVYYTAYTDYPDGYSGGLFYRVWPQAEAGSSVEVTAGTNVDRIVSGAVSGTPRYNIYLKDPEKNGSVQVKVTSESGNVTKTYTVVLNRTIAGASVTGLSNRTYTGSSIQPTVGIAFYGTRLKPGADYTIRYSGNKNIGTAKVIVSGIGDFRGTLTKSFRILPKKVQIKKPKAGKKKVTVKYATVSGGCSYQIGYRKKGSKSWKYQTSKTNSKTIKKLTSKKYYDVRVRAYKSVGGTKYYGAWSATKRIRIN